MLITTTEDIRGARLQSRPNSWYPQWCLRWLCWKSLLDQSDTFRKNIFHSSLMPLKSRYLLHPWSSSNKISLRQKHTQSPRSMETKVAKQMV